MRRITCVNATAFVFSLIFTASAVAGENSSLVAIPPQPNIIVGQHRSTGDSKMKASGERYTFVFSGDQIFPHMAMGGGWETILVLVNMSSTPISFTQKFFNTLGEPMRVTFRSVPERVVTTTASVDGRLAPNGTLNFVL